MFFSTVYDASMNLAEESERRCRQPVGRPGFWTQLTEVSSPLRVDDIFVFCADPGFRLVAVCAEPGR